MTLSFQLYSAKDAERQMLFEHLDQLETHDLLVLDQGYPARWLIAYLVQHGIQFCMRVDETGFAAVKTFLRSGLNEQRIIVGKPKARDCQRLWLPTLALRSSLDQSGDAQWPDSRHDDVVAQQRCVSCRRFRGTLSQPLAHRRGSSNVSSTAWHWKTHQDCRG